MKCFVCTGRESEFQMSGLADVELTGIFADIFKCNINSTAHIRDVVSADHDKTTVSAPAFCITRKLNRDNLRVRGLDSLVSCIDLSGCTCS